MKSRIYLLPLAISVLAATVPQLRAQLVADGATNTLSNVTNTITGDVTVGTNGSFTLLVLSDNALLTNSVNGVIGLNTTARSNEVRLLSPSARWQVGGSYFIVGSNGAFNRLVVSNGATVRDNLAIVGENASASNNLAVVTGSGSVWSNGLGFYLGFNGAGNQVVVSNGGVLQNNNSGYLLSSSNMAVVTGSGSTWTNELDLQIGNSGAGNQLVVSNGGAVRNGHGYVGVNPTASNNLALITGTGSVWSNATDLEVGAFSANNQMMISNGATVFTAGNGFVGAATNANANSVTLTDLSTRWLVGSNLYVGSNGASSRLIVSNGALVANNNSILGNGAISTNNSVLVTGSGSVWSNRFDLTVGFSGPGNQLALSNGAAAYVGRDSLIGVNSAANSNSVTVTDPGTSWLVASNLHVGSNGAFNRLVISNGGLLENGWFSALGYSATSSNNEGVISGAGSVWRCAASLDAGLSGAGNRLTITNGGKARSLYGGVGVNDGSSNNLATVTGPGSVWSNSLDFYLGASGSGNRLVVSNGALVVSSNGFLGLNTCSNNVAVVTGTGSGWTNANDLYIGRLGSANRLVASNGASIFVNNNSYIGFFASGSNNVAVVTDTGSVWTNSLNLHVGYDGSANQSVVSNGGLVYVGGRAVIGVNSGASSNSVIISDPGTSWTVTSDLYVGSNGPFSRLTINNGALTANSNAVVGSASSSSNNFVLVTGAGTLWSNRNDLTLGNFSVGNQVVVSNGAAVYVTAFGVIGANSGANSNSLTVDGPGSSFTSGTNVVMVGTNLVFPDFYVGSNGAFNRLIITNGGLVNSGEFHSIIGANQSSSNNEAVVTGPGSLWNSGANLLVGENFSSGNRLVITNGGSVRDGFGFIGASFGSNNTALVTGVGSSWTNLSQLAVGGVGGGSRLVITNGGLVNAGGNALYIGLGSSADNRVVVDGGTLLMSNQFTVGVLDIVRGTNVLNAGLIDAGQGLFLTNTQGFFEFNGGTLITRGASISNGAAFVVGTSATTPAIWDVRAGVSNHVLSIGLIVGFNSSFNQLLVTNGALLTNFFDLSIGSSGNSNVATIAGPGSRCGSGGSISLGPGAFNRLVVTNGGSLFGGGDAYVGGGLFSGANNQALITGPGSVWNQLGQLYVGYFNGGNQLLVSDGGLVVSTNSVLGPFSNSSNNVALVTGTGSVWNSLDSLYVGNNGARNQLQITNGGLVTAANAVLVGVANTSTNNSLLVDGSTLLVTNAAATGLLEILRGTNVFNSGLIAADIVRMTNSPQAVFQFNGGTLSARSSKISSGTILNIGNGVSPATMILAGNGTHDFSGNLLVKISSNAVLRGNGTLAGGISILSGGTLIPGSPVGKMIFTNAPSLQGTVIVEISKTGTILTNNQVQVVTGTLTYGGSLVVSNIGPTALAAGDRFQLFSATSYAGSFASLTLPPLDPTLTWNNKLLVDGSLEVSAPAAIALSMLSSGSSGSYTQNFDALSISGTTNLWRDNSTLLGWYAAQSASPFKITNYIPSDGSLNFGGLYSFGSSGSLDRALGSIPVNQSTEDIAYGLCFTNDTANSVSNFTISYTGEQWRNGGGTPRANTNTFWYRIGTSAITNPEPGVVTNWISVPTLDFTSPTVLASATALNGNAATNRHIFSSVLVPGLVVAPGQNVFFRWHDINDTGADHGLAVDDLSISFAPLASQITAIIVNPTNHFASITGQGESNLTYGIEAASNLTSPIFWQRIGSNMANTAGLFQFTDTNAPTFPMRFYRALFP